MEGYQSGLLQLYSEVEEKKVDWLWYPYIPCGKITVLQGDPGNGKSTLILNLIAALTTGSSLPGNGRHEPVRVIYQCAEDSIADTIKPRLVKAGADCGKVAFIKENDAALSLDDDRIRAAIVEFGAKMIVIDPVQAYLGDADLSNANSVRKFMRRLAMLAEIYDCAVVLVGHLNKKEGSKDLYRSLGSIDIMAAARSVLQIDYASGNGETRIIHQVKNSLAAIGRDNSFVIDSEGYLCWTNPDDKGSDGEESDDNGIVQMSPEKNDEQRFSGKQEIVAGLFKSMLSVQPEHPRDFYKRCQEFGIGKRTVDAVKQILGIKSIRKDGQWYWVLPSAGGETDAEEQRGDFNQNPQGCP